MKPNFYVRKWTKIASWSQGPSVWDICKGEYSISEIWSLLYCLWSSNTVYEIFNRVIVIANYTNPWIINVWWNIDQMKQRKNLRPFTFIMNQGWIMHDSKLTDQMFNLPESIWGLHHWDHSNKEKQIPGRFMVGTCGFVDTASSMFSPLSTFQCCVCKNNILIPKLCLPLLVRSLRSPCRTNSSEEVKNINFSIV